MKTSLVNYVHCLSKKIYPKKICLYYIFNDGRKVIINVGNYRILIYKILKILII